MRVSAVTPLFLLLWACGSQSQSSRVEVIFAHATDPHLFEDPSETGVADSVARRHREKLDRETFTAFLKSIRALAEADATPAFLVITGDFGIDYAWDPADTAGAGKKPQYDRERARQIDTTAALLGASPIRDIYVVPGNNDVPGQAASAAALASTGRFFDSVQARLDKGGKPVNLHNLAACYARDDAPASACVAEPAGSSIRLIGFPSYSFRNLRSGAYAANREAQEKQVDKFATLVARGAAEGKKILVLSHIPALDDPYQLARSRYAGLKPDTSGNGARPTWSAWNVSPKVFENWKKAIESPSVLGVLAGHFHDNRRELYDLPYRWSSASTLLPEPNKVLLAPPLAVHLQDHSPFQARGFELLNLVGDSLSRRIYWFDPEKAAFTPDPDPAARRIQPAESPSTVARFWNLGAPMETLSRAAILAIAFLAAFLTVVEIWKIPPPKTVTSDLVFESGNGSSATTAKGSAGTAAPAATTTTSGFQSNFARTVLSGLAGMAAVAFLEPLWAESGTRSKAYYLVLFIVFFMVFLLISAVYQGLTEGLRSWLVNRSRRPVPKTGTGKKERSSLWVESLLTNTLVAMETIFNVVQGKNQLKTGVWGNTIIELHKSLVRTVERVREEVDRAVRGALARTTNTPGLSERSVRVNISVLAEDGESVFYIASARGSLSKSFGKKSVAWASIASGEARWWKASYGDGADVTLFENADSALLGESGRLLLKAYFEKREPRDYGAFMIIPVPWAARGVSGTYRKAAIHISFNDEQNLDELVSGLDRQVSKPGAVLEPCYAAWRTLLEDPRPDDDKPKASATGGAPVRAGATNASEVAAAKAAEEKAARELAEAKLKLATTETEADRAAKAVAAAPVDQKAAAEAAHETATAAVSAAETAVKDAEDTLAEAKAQAAKAAGKPDAGSNGTPTEAMSPVIVQDSQLRAVLRESVEVLSEVLSRFDDRLYRSVGQGPAS